ncbi:MAG: LIC12162 family protein [Oligoflexia bacterium]|nr:LIC12162 family protein [Oligoflexia bacterium]
MLLVTTPDQRFRDANREICYLGEWSRPFPEQDAESAASLPYHWDDRACAANDFDYLRKLFERALAACAAQLNTIHATSYDNRYWRILIGPWLSAFLDISFDRYRCICMARDSGRIDRCEISVLPSYSWVQLRTSDFYSASATDRFSHDLFGRIIRALRPFPFDQQPSTSDPPPPESSKTSSTKARLRDLCVQLAQRAAPHRFIVMTSDVFSWKEKLKLHAHLCALPFISAAPRDYPNAPPSEQLRSALRVSLGNSEFERLVSQLLPEYFPTIYLEGYKRLRTLALELFPKSAKLIVTGAAQTGDEFFKCWTAEQLQTNSKLAIVQHGGLYGTNAWCSHEYNEVHSADRYYSWGWQDQHPAVAPLDAPKLIGIAGKIKPANKGALLMVLNAAPRYSYRHASWPISTQYLSYLADQVKFIEALPRAAAKHLRVRPYPLERGWEAEKRLRARLPDLILCGQQSMYDELNQSRLFIGTCNITTYLEALAANFPTVLFWNPFHWENRPSAAPYFEALRNADILFNDPLRAAAHVDKIWQSPLDWWHSSKVQEARRCFVERFAKCSTDWLSNWVSALKSLAQS